MRLCLDRRRPCQANRVRRWFLQPRGRKPQLCRYWPSAKEAVLRRRLDALLPADALISSFLVTDAQGNLLATTNRGAPVMINVADRDYFIFCARQRHWF